MATELKAGDVVIVLKNGKLETANVDRVTPKGWVVVRGGHPKEVDARYKPNGVNKIAGELTPVYVPVSGGANCVMYPWTETVFAGLQAECERRDEVRAAKAAEEAARVAESKRLRDAEMADVRAAVGDIARVQVLGQVYPSGERMYVLNAPVNPEYAERKHGYEVVIVRCKDDTRTVFGQGEVKVVPCVRFTAASFNGDSCGFTTRTGTDADNDEAAKWEVLRDVYASCW